MLSEEVTISEGDFTRFLRKTYVFFSSYQLLQASGPGWGSQFVEPEEEPVKDEDEVTTAEAEEEYKRVFAECLENNFDLDLATKTAKAAMRAALNIVDSEDESDENEEEDEYDEEMEDLTRGITVIEPPRYFYILIQDPHRDVHFCKNKVLFQ